jgi:hypothetical protein
VPLKNASISVTAREKEGATILSLMASIKAEGAAFQA